MTSWLTCQVQAVNPAEELGSVTGQAFDLLRVLFIIAAVLLLTYVAVRYGLPLIVGLKNVAAGPIQILARASLEPKKNIYLLKVGSEMLLVGTSDGGMHFLKSLDAATVGPLLESIQSSEARDPQRFQGILQELKKRNPPRSDP